MLTAIAGRPKPVSLSCQSPSTCHPCSHISANHIFLQVKEVERVCTSMSARLLKDGDDDGG